MVSMEILIGMIGAIGRMDLLEGSGLMLLMGGLLVGMLVLLAILWLRARYRLQEMHADLRNLQQQVVALSEQLCEAEQQRFRELKQWVERRSPVSPLSADSDEVSLWGKVTVPQSDDVPADTPSETVEAAGTVASVSSADEQLLAAAQGYIEEQMARSDLSVEEVSKALGVSRVHLYKKLVLLTGLAPLEYIRHLRLQRAAELLRTTALPIGEIGNQVGIQSPKKFSHYFKKEFGMVPSTYQRTFSSIGRFTGDY